MTKYNAIINKIKNWLDAVKKDLTDALDMIWYGLILAILAVTIWQYIISEGPAKSIVVHQNLYGEWGIELGILIYLFLYSSYKGYKFISKVAYADAVKMIKAGR